MLGLPGVRGAAQRELGLRKVQRVRAAALAICAARAGAAWSGAMLERKHMSNPVVVEVLRGERVESRHRGAGAVIDSGGRVVFEFGDIDGRAAPVDFRPVTGDLY